MRYFGKIAGCVAGWLVLNTSLGADSPYVPIAARNIFGLNPPQAISPVDATPPPTITPDGIMTIFGSPQVLFKVDVPPRPPEPATEKSYVLSEGQRQDDIEVTHINEKTGVVTFNNHGVVQEIPLVKAPAINTPTPVVMNLAAPAGVNSGFAVPASGPGRFGGPGGGNYGNFGNNPGQNPNLGNNGGNAGNNFGNPGGNNGSQSFGSTGGGSAGGPAQPQLSPEAQTLLIAAQKAQAKQAGDPVWRIFPPTELDQEAGTVNSLPPAGGQ